MERKLNKHERGELVRRAARMIRRRTKNTRQLRKELGNFNALCTYCPWTDGRIMHPTNEHCVARYCDDAAETFYDEESRYFDDTIIK